MNTFSCAGLSFNTAPVELIITRVDRMIDIPYIVIAMASSGSCIDFNMVALTICCCCWATDNEGCEVGGVCFMTGLTREREVYNRRMYSYQVHTWVGQ